MRVSSFCVAILLAQLLARASPQNSKPTSCGSCHTQRALSQPSTPMGRALELPGTNSVLQSHPRLSVRQGAFTYTIETRGNLSTYSVSDGTGNISVPIRWAFGAKSQTYVLERNGHLYESMVSFYPKIDGLDVTMGDQVLHPKSLEEAFGRELPQQQATACFGCHSTGAVVNHTLHLESLRPGVTCEHCHTGAAEHFKAISQGRLTALPPDLKKLSSEELSNFCGQCHRSWETVVRDRIRGEINVRFQPYRLALSQCFDGSDARIKCIACHDPHRQLARNDVSYDSKCLACHPSGTVKTAALHPVSGAAKQQTRVARACPVATSKCVSCHMPKVDLPGGHQTFTDHFIRIVKPNELYPD